ncbi:MAG: hypothetical protein KTR17_11160, partial [Cellvibrionaceae bacterium]|nr:hypothetical protein [Cellvibrionaceae bacterium]
YSSNGINVFLWHKKTLISAVAFDNDKSSKQAFAEYLQNSPAVDSQLLVDIIDEDFRRESIPHVNARDRKALIQRLADRYYRDEEYYQVKLLGRSQQGRKDDNILLSSLSNFEKISPWMTIIEENAVAIAGIWSVPHLTLELLKFNKVSGDNILLITRELPWSQRETFFHKGKMLFSRLERLDINLYENTDPDLSWQYLSKGAEKIQHFLTNQRIVGFNDEIQVVGFVATSPAASTISQANSNLRLNYRVIEEQKITRNFATTQAQPLKCDAIYAWICAQKSFFSSHYNTKEIKKYFIRYYMAKSFKTVSYFTALFVLSIAAFFGLQTLKTNKDILAIEYDTQRLKKQYADQFHGIANQLADAHLVEGSVTHATLLDLESGETPQKYFSYISTVFSKKRFNLLELDEFTWTKHPREAIEQMVNQFTARSPAEEGHTAAEEYQQTPSQPSTKYQPILRLGGKLNRARLDYRNTVTVMSEFVNSLQNLPIVSDIHLIKTPVDIRPKSKFSDMRGTDEASLLKNIEADRYEILIVLQPNQGSKS